MTITTTPDANATARLPGAAPASHVRYRLVVDDADRGPDTAAAGAWTANLFDDNDEHLVEPGLGATPAAALIDLLAGAETEFPAFHADSLDATPLAPTMRAAKVATPEAPDALVAHAYSAYYLLDAEDDDQHGPRISDTAGFEVYANNPLGPVLAQAKFEALRHVQGVAAFHFTVTIPGDVAGDPERLSDFLDETPFEHDWEGGQLVLIDENDVGTRFRAAAMARIRAGAAARRGGAASVSGLLRIEVDTDYAAEDPSTPLTLMAFVDGKDGARSDKPLSIGGEEAILGGDVADLLRELASRIDDGVVERGGIVIH